MNAPVGVKYARNVAAKRKKGGAPWAARQRRAKTRAAPADPATLVHARVNAALRLHRQLSNFIASGGNSKVVDDDVRESIDRSLRIEERESSERLSRHIGALALAVPKCTGADGRERLAQIVDWVRGLRLTHFRTNVSRFAPHPQKSNAQPADADPWPSDRDAVIDELARIAGIVHPAKPRGGRKAPVARTELQRAVLAYNVLAEGSAASVQPDANLDRTRVRDLLSDPAVTKGMRVFQNG